MGDYPGEAACDKMYLKFLWQGYIIVMSKFIPEVIIMNFKKIDIAELGFDPFEMIGSKWMLVTAGTPDSYNTMTASWGFSGVMWGKNCAVTVIRPQRYTKEFIDREELFTLSFYGEEMRDALKFCGSHSGRDCDKADETGLIPVEIDGSVTFEQAQLTLVCKKLYVQDMKADCFSDETVAKLNYPTGDFHTAYIGEILAAYQKEL